MIFRSIYPDVEIPEDVSVTDYVLAAAEGRENAPAIIEGLTGETVTFGELVASVRRVAGALQKRGLGKGDVVSIYSANTVTYPIAFHGIALAGGIVTTVNPTYTAEELASQIDDSKARFLITLGSCLEKARAAAEAAGGVEEIFTFDGADGTTPFAELMAGPEIEDIPSIDPMKDLVALPYSSGTTGVSKGVMLSHHNLVANMCQLDGMQNNRGFREGDRFLAVLPFFHIYGLLVIMNWVLSHGAAIVVMTRFDLEDFLRILQDRGVTYAHLVPPILLALAKHPLVDQFDLSKLDGIMSGAAPLGADLQEAVEQRLGVVVCQGYGLTETSPVTHHAPNAEPGLAPPASIGPSIPNTEVRIVDVDTGEELGPNQRGEIWVRGPQVMVGYLGRPDATAATIDEEGWLHTGDVGYVDDRGFAYIVDRVKELIKYKGFQVAPAELEALLITHPQVRDVAVIRSPDEEAGEVPKAFLVTDGMLSADEIMTWVADKVAPHKKVRLVEFVDQIPKSASGKILRRLLVAQEEERRAAEARS